MRDKHPAEDVFDKRAADKLAYECARAVELGTIGARSAIGDALLVYLNIGGVGGPSTVPQWVEQYKHSEGRRQDASRQGPSPCRPPDPSEGMG